MIRVLMSLVLFVCLAGTAMAQVPPPAPPTPPTPPPTVINTTPWMTLAVTIRVPASEWHPGIGHPFPLDAKVAEWAQNYELSMFGGLWHLMQMQYTYQPSKPASFHSVVDNGVAYWELRFVDVRHRFLSYSGPWR